MTAFDLGISNAFAALRLQKNRFKFGISGATGKGKPRNSGELPQRPIMFVMFGCGLFFPGKWPYLQTALCKF
ncbi:MAG: hypothetical protein CMJ81_04525 [Planctomycetaceae bacterium]|jgi:hypothetical protein|nr:hypothetical protein [Planctomycetaceae bacterium]MBP63700.1 hypothetical protein [Planctomycetaceae bacterium]